MFRTAVFLLLSLGILSAAPYEMGREGSPATLPVIHEPEIPYGLAEDFPISHFALPMPEQPIFCGLAGVHVRTFSYYAPPQDLMSACLVRTSRYGPMIRVRR